MLLGGKSAVVRSQPLDGHQPAFPVIEVGIQHDDGGAKIIKGHAIVDEYLDAVLIHRRLAFSASLPEIGMSVVSADPKWKLLGPLTSAVFIIEPDEGNRIMFSPDRATVIVDTLPEGVAVVFGRPAFKDLGINILQDGTFEFRP